MLSKMMTQTQALPEVSFSRTNAFPLSNWYISGSPAATPDCVCSVTLAVKKPCHSHLLQHQASSPTGGGPLCFPPMQPGYRLLFGFATQGTVDANGPVYDSHQTVDEIPLVSA